MQKLGKDDVQSRQRKEGVLVWLCFVLSSSTSEFQIQVGIYF